MTIAIDPLDDNLDDAHGAAREFIEAVLRQAGLFGGSHADGWSADADLEAIHASLPEPASDESYLATEDAIHAWVEGHYGSDHSRLATTEALLESHVLGPMWNSLTEEEQRFLATAEIFWQDHAGAVGMDFGPVVIEIAKAFESLAVRTVIDPFRGLPRDPVTGWVWGQAACSAAVGMMVSNSIGVNRPRATWRRRRW